MRELNRGRMFEGNRYRLNRPIVGVLMLGALSLAGAATTTDKPSDEVSLYVTVEEDGGLVQGLSDRNFRLYEDGEPRLFQLKQPEQTATVALLVENSQNSWNLFYNDIQYAVQGFLDAAPEGYWYALATYSHGLEVNVDFTKLKGKIRTAFADLAPPTWNEVDTYDAIYDMLDKMERLPGRRVLIVVGSGYDTFSAHTFSDIQKKVEEANVAVFSVGLGSLLRGIYEPYLGDMERTDLLQVEAFLRMLADESGGEAWFPNIESAFPDVMKGIVQTLQNQYMLVYTPNVPHDEKLHKIRVEAFQVVNDHRRDFKVRVRKGWRL